MTVLDTNTAATEWAASMTVRNAAHRPNTMLDLLLQLSAGHTTNPVCTWAHSMLDFCTLMRGFNCGQREVSNQCGES